MWKGKQKQKRDSSTTNKAKQIKISLKHLTDNTSREHYVSQATKSTETFLWIKTNKNFRTVLFSLLIIKEKNKQQLESNVIHNSCSVFLISDTVVQRSSQLFHIRQPRT